MRTFLMMLWLPALLLPAASAEKDSDYYLSGFSNPNVKHEMYWKDSINVLQDLDQFESLYITYHHCVWSKYGTRYGSGQNYDEQGADNEEEFENGCGGYGGEYFWYMGRTQCFKANAAYSLYGVLKGNSVPSSPCSKGTYINSFFTTFGAESFTGPLGLGVDTINSQCQENEPDQMYLDDDQAAADDDYLDDNFQFYNYKAYSSSGTGCQNKNFVTDSYKGAFCHGRNYLETTSTLDDLNDMLKGMQCTEIYNVNSNNNNEGRRLDEEDINFEEMDPIGILSYSKSCSLRQYPRDCPDPYGLKKKYSRAINRAFEFKTGGSRDFWMKTVKGVTWLGALAGVVFLVLSVVVQKLPVQKRGRKKRRRRRRKKRKDKDGKSILGSFSKSNSRDDDPGLDAGLTPSFSHDEASPGWTSFGSDTEKSACDTATDSAPENSASSKKSHKRRLSGFFKKKTKDSGAI